LTFSTTTTTITTIIITTIFMSGHSTSKNIGGTLTPFSFSM
jgi:hypothetical protein